MLSAAPLNATEHSDPATVEPPVETVQIDETTYIVPEPWIGNRITAPSLPMSAFQMIPADHTRNGSRLYVVKETQLALVKLLKAAKKDGIELRVESGYRSPAYQKKIISRMLNEGRTFDDIIRYVAPPGYSEHALGTAVDFYPSNWGFSRLPAYIWLQEHGGEFGFTETYPQHNNKHFPWEAWHWTYRGETQTVAKEPETETIVPRG